MPFTTVDKRCAASKISAAVVLCRSFAPTVATTKTGLAEEQKLQICVAVWLSKLLSAMHFAPSG